MHVADLRVFEAVARLGGMSRAAAELHTVQSNVTARIRVLEDELGTPLFERSSRGVALTAAGRRLLPYASRMRRLLDDARRAATDEGTPRGPLAVGSLETTAAVRLSPVLATYAATYPDVDLSLVTGTTCELIDAVLEHRVEGAFVCGPVRHAELAEETVFTEELVLVTAPGVPSLDDVVRHGDVKIIVLRAGCSYRWPAAATPRRSSRRCRMPAASAVTVGGAGTGARAPSVGGRARRPPRRRDVRRAGSRRPVVEGRHGYAGGPPSVGGYGGHVGAPMYKWQATCCPPSRVSSGGSTSEHTAIATGQRV